MRINVSPLTHLMRYLFFARPKQQNRLTKLVARDVRAEPSTASFSPLAGRRCRRWMRGSPRRPSACGTGEVLLPEDC